MISKEEDEEDEEEEAFVNSDILEEGQNAST